MKVKIKAFNRDLGKKSDLKNLRKLNYIPGIIYGPGEKDVPISVKKNEFYKIYRKTIGEMALFELDVDGEKFLTVIKERQIHPVTREVLHIDFLHLHQGVPITVSVPIKFLGESKGVKQGGILEVHHRALDITCLPKDIPEDIEVDVSDLGIGRSIRLSDLNLKSELEVKLPKDTPIVSVLESKKLAATSEEEAEEGEESSEE